MRPIIPLVLSLWPAGAMATCSAEMRICTYAPAGGDVLLAENCSFTQCASGNAVFDYFRFLDGSYVRIDYAPTQTLFQGRLDFVLAGIGPVEGASQKSVMLDSDPDQRHVDAGPSGQFFTSACDDRCAGDDADTYGQ